MPFSRRANQSVAALMGMMGKPSSRSSLSATPTIDKFVPHCTMASGAPLASLRITASQVASGTCAMSVALPHLKPWISFTSKPISLKNLITFLSPIVWYGVMIDIVFALNFAKANLHASAPVATLRPQRPEISSTSSRFPCQPPKNVSKLMPMITYSGSAVMPTSIVCKISRRNCAKNSSMSSSEDSLGAAIKIGAAWNPTPLISGLEKSMRQKSYSTIVFVDGITTMNFRLCSKTSGKPASPKSSHFSGSSEADTKHFGYPEFTSGIRMVRPVRPPTTCVVRLAAVMPFVYTFVGASNSYFNCLALPEFCVKSR
mmetsp:Transcript_119598/g.338529  ORF Transcript_119598/g.338529 Transcript_119598/m.338529 type:complete len:315 (+) Transcript_119598:129-1073(+)